MDVLLIQFRLGGGCTHCRVAPQETASSAAVFLFVQAAAHGLPTSHQLLFLIVFLLMQAAAHGVPTIDHLLS